MKKGRNNPAIYSVSVSQQSVVTIFELSGLVAYATFLRVTTTSFSLLKKEKNSSAIVSVYVFHLSIETICELRGLDAHALSCTSHNYVFFFVEEKPILDLGEY